MRQKEPVSAERHKGHFYEESVSAQFSTERPKLRDIWSTTVGSVSEGTKKGPTAHPIDGVGPSEFQKRGGYIKECRHLRDVHKNSPPYPSAGSCPNQTYV